MNERIGKKIKLTSYEELLGVGNEESAVDVEINQIHGFVGHPFKVLDDQRMKDLVESIKVNGILTPVLIRPSKVNRGYEMISGHRRMHAAKLAGLTVIPAIVRELDDDTAVLVMVDANIQREELLPSEKAFAYKMKMEAMRRKAGRPMSDNCRQVVGNYETADVIGRESGESGRQVQRYIRLTKLIPEILDYVDKKRIKFTVAVEISHIDCEIQRWIYEYIRENGAVKLKQITMLRSACEHGAMTQEKMIRLLNQSQNLSISSSKNIISDEILKSYFPEGTGAEEMRKVVFGLLGRWLDERRANNEEI